MKTYIVTVERLMLDRKVYSTESFRILAHSPEEAEAIVSNSMELHYEPRFRVSNVEEVKNELG